MSGAAGQRGSGSRWPWAARAGLLGLLVSGCGTAALGGPVPDGGSDGLAEVGVSPRWPRACGGVVQAAGTIAGQPFSAGYVSASSEPGDCGGNLRIILAEDDTAASTAVQLWIIPDAMGSFVGSDLVAATIARAPLPPPAVTRTDIQLISSPDAGSLNSAPSAAPVVGTFTLGGPDVSVTGSFSTPVCGLDICI